MDLRWWALAIAGVLCLVTAGVAAWQLPVARAARRMRPLANVDRLTRLPEYVRVHRIYVISTAIAAVLMAVAFSGALLASARPQVQAAADDGFDAAHPLDVMVCIGQSVTDPTTADVLNYYADRAESFTSQRIGVTSSSLRAMPLTGDHQFAVQRLRYFAKLAQIQQDLNTNKAVSDADRLELAAGIDAFQRSVRYVDYVGGAEDRLALCMSGFSDTDSFSNRRKQVVYVGYASTRSPDDTRRPLFDAGTVLAMAQRTGIQLNAIARSDVTSTIPPDNDGLRSLVEATGGRFSLYNPAGTAPGDGGGRSAVLTDDLDAISDNPPAAVLAGGRQTQGSYDAPQVALGVAVVAVALLSCSLAVLRR